MVGCLLAEYELGARIGEPQNGREYGTYGLEDSYTHRGLEDEEGEGELEKESAEDDPEVDLPVAVADEPCQGHNSDEAEHGDPTFQAELLMRLIRRKSLPCVRYGRSELIIGKVSWELSQNRVFLPILSEPILRRQRPRQADSRENGNLLGWGYTEIHAGGRTGDRPQQTVSPGGTEDHAGQEVTW